MNANLTLSEIVTIAFVLLLVFGPHRLPEMAKRAGEVLGKLRQTASSLREEFTAEYEDLAKPLTDLDAEIKAVKADLTGAMPKLDHLMSDDKPDADPDGTPSEKPAAKNIDDELAQARKDLQQERRVRDEEPPAATGTSS